MSYSEPEKYFNLAGFMSSKEVDKIFDILENALDRKGWHISKDAHQPDLYYYWDAPIEEIYYWRDAFPKVDCMCEICFDIANEEKKIIWADH